MTTLVAGSPEWLAERRRGIGGSDIGAVLGVSRFGSAMSVFMDKRGLSAPLIETEAMRFGNLLEDVVAREYALKSGRKVRRAAGFIRHAEYPWAFANIDRYSDKVGTPRRILEVKTTGAYAAEDFGEVGTDQVPASHVCQTQWYLACAGKDTADLAVLIGGQKHRIYTIERDNDLIREMFDVAAAFWEDTQAGRPPDIDGSLASAEYLKATFRDKGTERPMTGELASLATMYQGLHEGIKADEARRKAVGNEIRDLMGDHRWAEGEGVKVVYAERAGARRVDWAGLVKARRIPEALIEEFASHDEPVRALTVTIKPA